MSATTRPDVRHRETLLPSASFWFASVAIAATSGLTVLQILGTAGAVVVALAAAAAVAATILATGVRIEVADGELRAGRASIPVHLLGRVRVVDADRMAALRGPQADARAYLCQRGWVREGVLAEVVDPQDPTPYWLVSSRHPQRLAAAITAAGAGNARDEPRAGRSGSASD